MKTQSKVITTIIAMITVLIFFSMQGTVVYIFQLTGAAARVIPALILWVLAAISLVFFKAIKMPLSEAGFKSPEKGSFKKLFYLIPLIVIGLLGIIGGIDFSQGIVYILSSLLYVLAIGFSEELYFRSIICNIWKSSGEKKAVILSAALFGACHSLQAMANPDLLRTILAICFAFFYGIAFAQVFIITKSIWPCIAIHAFHDFCSFIGKSIGSEANIILVAVQTVLILIFVFVTFPRISNMQSNNSGEENEKTD